MWIYIHISQYSTVSVGFSWKIWERENEQEGQRKRENCRQTLLSVEPNAGLNPRTLRSWPEAKPRVGRSTNCATHMPLLSFFKQADTPYLISLCHLLSLWLSISFLLQRLLFHSGLFPLPQLSCPSSTALLTVLWGKLVIHQAFNCVTQLIAVYTYKNYIVVCWNDLVCWSRFLWAVYLPI